MRAGNSTKVVVPLVALILVVVLAGCRGVARPGGASPVFAPGTDASREVAENTTAGTAIGDAFVADGDDVSYALAGDDADSFAIGAASGVLAARAALDYESKASYAVTVRASDAHGNAATLDVTIVVTDVDEAGSVSFDSTVPAVGTALTANVADPDGSVSSVTWQWAKSATQAGTYRDISGATSATYAPVSGDVGAWLRATASYADAHGTGKSAVGIGTAAVALTIAADDESPVFAPGTGASREVAENTAAGTAIGAAFVATDADGDGVSYALEGTDAASFELGADSGVLRTRASLDYESKASYAVTVKASDGHGNAATLAVTITVTDVDEAGSISFDSTAPAVGTALTASVADPDGSVSSMTWQWAKSATQAGTYRDISGATAARYTPVAADAGAWLRATASYTDRHGAGKSAAGVADAAVSTEPEPQAGKPTLDIAATVRTSLWRRGFESGETSWLDVTATLSRPISSNLAVTVYVGNGVPGPYPNLYHRVYGSVGVWIGSGDTTGSGNAELGYLLPATGTFTIYVETTDQYTAGQSATVHVP